MLKRNANHTRSTEFIPISDIEIPGVLELCDDDLPNGRRQEDEPDLRECRDDILHTIEMIEVNS